jgi:dolichyl-phosphate-mannose--protein O-mannosyl transferase
MIASVWLLAAAAVMGTTTLAHAIGGTGQYLAPSLAMDASADWKAVQEVVWHFVTAFLAVTTVALLCLALSQRKQTALLAFIFALQVAFAGLFVFYGAARLGGITGLPQWTAFLAVAALISAEFLSTKNARA